MDSPFAHLINTNTTPSDAEMVQLRDFLSLPMKELSRIDAEISRLQELIADLEHQREKLSKNINAHRALISPIRRLPRELLQEIFIRCLPTDRNSAMSRFEAPMLLGRICSAWRIVSLSTPELWSSLHAVVYHDSPEGRHRLRSRCKLVRVWLSRSGSFPLSISLAALEYRDINEEMVSQLMKCLIPFSRRWKIVNFMVPHSSLKPLAALMQEDVPLLEVMKVEDLTSFRSIPGADDESWNMLGFLSAAPRLRSVSFTKFQADFRVWSLPWTSLTELHLAAGGWRPPFNMEPGAALQILNKCPKLTACSLTLQPTPTTDPLMLAAPLTSVTLPDLQSLWVSGGGDLVPFFGNLILPALWDLEIRNGDIQPISSSPVLPLLSGHLERLCLNSVTISEDTLIEFLQANSSLTKLIVQDWVPEQTMYSGQYGEPIICERILKLLTLTEGGTEMAGPLCPSLEIIRVASCGTFSDDLLLDFFESRTKPILPGVARLKCADISFYRDIKVDILRRAKRLSIGGLQVNLNPGLVFDHPWAGLVCPYSSFSDLLRMSAQIEDEDLCHPLAEKSRIHNA